MMLRGINFGNIFGASGVEGFFGEGYWFHRTWRKFGLDFSGMTFVAKTATLAPREGNMALTKRFTPRSPIPSCIKARVFRGAMLNAVGLANPGIEAFLQTGKWQTRVAPFWLSVASLAGTRNERIEEFRRMVDMVGREKESFRAPFGVQINLSCPNTGHNTTELIKESAEALEVVSALGVPLMPKYSIASAPISAIRELEAHPHCDAICVSNTLPFGWEGADWKRVWGSKYSPLARFGGGGLSGAPLRPFVCGWITRLREAGFRKPINGGGGVLSVSDVEAYRRAGASSVFIGSVATLRPWRVRSIIRYANHAVWQ